MSISVVIPNFNHGKLLPRAVLAVMRQNPPPHEIIIINDGSTDHSLDVIRSLQCSFPCIHAIHHKENKGVVAAMNEGLSVATGDLVYFAAADDFCLPSLFAAADRALRSFPEAAFFCGRVVLVNCSGTIVGFRPFMLPSARAAFLSPAKVRARIAVSDHWCVGPAVIYRRDRLLAAGGFDETMGAFTDGLIVRRLALDFGFYFDPIVVVAWQISPDSLSARTALSIAENTDLIAKAVDAVRATFPADVSKAYADILDRRLRFNMARLWLVFDKISIDSDGLSQVLRFSGFQRTVLQSLACLPFARYAVLIWMALVLRPYGRIAVLAGFYRALRSKFLQVRAVADTIAKAREPIALAVRRAESDGEVVGEPRSASGSCR
jgi:glycosyltransferase involved in cell wall biosynthesis